MKTSELAGAALDWAVCVALGRTDMQIDPDDGELMASDDFDYSTDWAQGGPIIDREGIDIIMVQRDLRTWAAEIYETPTGYKRQQATTPLIAAMRCFVASKLGDTVEIPEELQNEN